VLIGDGLHLAGALALSRTTRAPRSTGPGIRLCRFGVLAARELADFQALAARYIVAPASPS
jgi:hypothetical protein